MALSKENRDFLARSTAACIVMAGLVVFACVKLSKANRNNRNAEKGKTVAVVDGPENGTSGKDPFAMSDTVRLMPDTVRFGGVDSLQVEIVKRDGIIAQKDSIIADRDTALAVMAKDLQDCKNSKKPETKKPETKKTVEKKPEVKKPVEKKPEVKKPVEKKPEVKQPEEKKPVCEPKPVTPVHVEFNDDSHDNVVNVNNGIVINNNYNAVVDTIKAAQKNIQYSVGKAYTGRMVRCK